MTKIRQNYYLISGAIAGILPLLAFLKVLSSEQAVNLASLVDNVGSLIGAGAAVTAGAILNRQRKDGTVDAPEVSALDQVIANIPVVVQEANDAVARLDRLKQAAGESLGTIPVFGPEAQAVLNSIRLP
ncbi:holin [Mycobacterium phage MyraDee]|uniref:Holin n=1 Tax=Mycobacterium phage MyraDee TaxID=2024303 RepID=A0A222Z037_9CAUD|nr:holin [Mycobacterium phage MyraDee]ASR77116.1 holin [Mycobacterium phage MyraDee]